MVFFVVSIFKIFICFSTFTLVYSKVICLSAGLKFLNENLLKILIIQICTLSKYQFFLFVYIFFLSFKLLFYISYISKKLFFI